MKITFKHYSVRKNLLLSVSFGVSCFCWGSALSLGEMDQKIKFVGLIGFGNSCLDSVFRYSKVFRLHGILHDAAGTLRSHSGKGPGYCYVIGRGPISCLLGYVNGLLFRLYVKIFLPSIFNSVESWSSMSCIVLDSELTHKNKIKKLGLFIDGSVQGFSVCPPNLLNLINKRHGTQVIYMELRGVLESWILRSCLLSFTTWK